MLASGVGASFVHVGFAAAVVAVVKVGSIVTIGTVTESGAVMIVEEVAALIDVEAAISEGLVEETAVRSVVGSCKIDEEALEGVIPLVDVDTLVGMITGKVGVRSVNEGILVKGSTSDDVWLVWAVLLETVEELLPADEELFDDDATLIELEPCTGVALIGRLVEDTGRLGDEEGGFFEELIDFGVEDRIDECVVDTEDERVIELDGELWTGIGVDTIGFVTDENDDDDFVRLEADLADVEIARFDGVDDDFAEVEAECVELTERDKDIESDCANEGFVVTEEEALIELVEGFVTIDVETFVEVDDFGEGEGGSVLLVLDAC